MKENKEKLIKKLTLKFSEVDLKQISQKLNEKYNIPIGISTDILSAQKYLDEYSEFILFCFCDIITPESVEKYFVDKEISFYSQQKYKVETVEFPIDFNVVQIADDQWIGSYTMLELMKLRAAGLINYNINTQRILSHIVKGNKDSYTIAINRNNVSKIKGIVKRREFIPNTITLNIQEDDPIADFQYKDGKLIVNSITAFDIIDGFHRYVAFGEIHDDDADFDYPIEIRIVNFSEFKGKQFTYQEDQKTTMKKVDSDSLNQYDLYNMLVQRLNEDATCDFRGLFGINKLIHSGYFANALKLYNLSNRKDMINLEKDIKEKLNSLVMIDPNLLDMVWKPYHIFTLCWCFYNEKSPEITVKAIYKTNELPKEVKESFAKMRGFIGRTPKTKKYIENIVKGVEKNV